MNSFLIISFGILIFAIIGGWLSRMCGGAPPKLSWGLDQWIYALPYLVISLPAIPVIAGLMSLEKRRFSFAHVMLFFPFATAFTGKRTGHGGGIDMGTSSKEPGEGRTIEKLEYLIYPLHGKIPMYWYDAILLAITGLAVTLVPSVMVMFADVISGLCILASGLLKAPAYMVGAAIYPQRRGRGIPYLNEATAIGEFLTGFFGYAAIAFAAARIFNLGV